MFLDPGHRIRLQVQVGARLGLNRQRFFFGTRINPTGNWLYFAVFPI
jgi:hypothetical protein